MAARADEGFRNDPCGSGSPSDSPYSGRSTPNFLQWAEDLRNVLNDYDGLELFKSFLDEAGNRELRFWYACKGFKDKFKACQDCKRGSGDFSAIKRLAEEIKSEFIKSKSNNSLQCLNEAAMQMRVEVERKISTGQIDLCLFDNVQEVVEKALCARHAQFVQSPVYINYVQRVLSGHQESGDQPTVSSRNGTEGGAQVADDSPCPSNGSSSGGSSDPHQPSAGLLPTVLEDPELECASGSSVDGADRGRHRSFSGDGGPSTFLGHEWRVDPHVSVSSNREPAPSIEDLNVVTCSVGAQGTPGPASHLSNSLASPNINVAPSCSSASTATSAIPKRKSSTQTPTSTSSTLVGPSTPQKLTPNTLVRSFQDRMRSTMPSTKPGIPPNPYHTTRPYVPYLTTSAQDSELQSMSSDAATESSVSGVGYKISERTALRNAKQNTDSQKFIPRTKRPPPNDPQLNDMRNEVFRNELIKKLEKIRKDQECDEILRRTISPHENVSIREAVQNYCLLTKPCEMDEGGVEILDAHFSRLGWQDSPKQSPLRSPSFGGPFRRRSPPVAKLPAMNRIMTSSYPSCVSTSPNPVTLPLMGGAVAAGGVAPAGPNVHQVYPSSSKQGVVNVAASTSGIQVQRYYPPSTKPKYLSDDTSGISSYVSTTDSSAVNAAQLASNASKKGKKFGKTIRKQPNSIGGTSCGTTTGVQTDAAIIGNMPNSRSATATASNTQQSEHLTVIYFLPNEPTPFKTKFHGPQMDLKQFKSIIPKKQGSFKYYFKCVSKDVGEVWEEISEDRESIPFHGDKEITARVEISEDRDSINACCHNANEISATRVEEH